MSEQTKPRSIKNCLSLEPWLCVFQFLVTMAFLAVNSDAKNQEKYKQQQADMIAQIEAREAAEKSKAEQAAQATQAASEAETNSSH